MSFWTEVRRSMALKAHRSIPRGEAVVARSYVRPIDAEAQGFDDNGLFEDITGLSLIGIDAIIGSSQFTVE